MITGAAFVDLFASYDTVNHKFLIQKLYNLTQDNKLCRILQNMLPNKRLYVELNNKCSSSRWRKYKITNDHHFIRRRSTFVTAQYSSFTEVDKIFGDALDKSTQYYKSYSRRATPDKTQVNSFHLRNKDAKQSLKVVWNRTDQEKTQSPPEVMLLLNERLATNTRLYRTRR